MNAKIRDDVWERDGGLCQRCKKRLYREVDQYEKVIENLLSLTDIPIYKWPRECWKCHRQTDVVSYDFAVGFSYHIGDLEKIDGELADQFPFVKKVFSKTCGRKVAANTCIRCGAPQGNWFIMEDMAEMEASGSDMKKLIERKLKNTLAFEDLPIEKEDLEPLRERLLFHVHHMDRNPENNDIQNLILLCRKCHIKIHSEIRSGTM